MVQKNNEIKDHFEMRKSVFDRALASGLEEERAYLLASVFSNCYHYGAEYNLDVVQESQKFWEKEWLSHYQSFKAT
jgi:hypothetical protein